MKAAGIISLIMFIGCLTVLAGFAGWASAQPAVFYVTDWPDDFDINGHNVSGHNVIDHAVNDHAVNDRNVNDHNVNDHNVIGHAINDHAVLYEGFGISFESSFNGNTFIITPENYKPLESFASAKQIIEFLEIPAYTIYDSFIMARGVVYRFRAALLFSCLLLITVLTAYLWRAAKHWLNELKGFYSMYYFVELLKAKSAWIALRATIITMSITGMIVLWQLCTFEPVWADGRSDSLLENWTTVLYPAFFQGSALYSINAAVTVLTIVTVFVGFVNLFINISIYFHGWRTINIDTSK